MTAPTPEEFERHLHEGRIRKWLRDRRWRREQSAREGWLQLIDSQGRVVAQSPVMAVPTEHGKFTNVRPVSFVDLPTTHVVSIRLIDVDGNARDTPIEDAWGIH